VDMQSVWNWDKGKYDYYRTRTPRTYRERSGYPSTKSLKGVGDIPEDSTHPLQSGSVYVGSGDEAIGTVSSGKKRNGTVFVAVTLLALYALR
jgi:hypothetical protein